MDLRLGRHARDVRGVHGRPDRTWAFSAHALGSVCSRVATVTKDKVEDFRDYLDAEVASAPYQNEKPTAPAAPCGTGATESDGPLGALGTGVGLLIS